MNPIVLSQMTPIVVGDEAALYDLGDGIACLEFRSKGNSITPAVRAFIIEVLDTHMVQFQGLVIGNQSKNFSVGANLVVIKEMVEVKDDAAFVERIQSFQAMTQRLKSYPKPIVAAPYAMTLGGGLETALHCHARAVSQKAYFGLVEAGVGLLPGGGGVKETALSVYETAEEKRGEALKDAYEKLVLRKVSRTAEEAKSLGYVKAGDTVVEETCDLLSKAKALCLLMTEQSIPNYREIVITRGGAADYAMLLAHGKALLERGKISSYDYCIGQVIAEVLTGGEVPPHTITESKLLEEERNGFLALTKNKETYERICHFVETGKLLSN